MWLCSTNSTGAHVSFVEPPADIDPDVPAAGPSVPSGVQVEEISSWWRRGLALMAVSGIGIATLAVFGTSAGASIGQAFAVQKPAAVSVSGEPQPESVGEARATVRDLSAHRAGLVAQAVERIGDWPTKGSVSSGFGMRVHPILGTLRLHNGADIGGRCGQPIYAAQSGTVTKADSGGYNGGSGNNVRIDHGDIDGVNVQTAYLQMSKIGARVGQRLSQGDVIGKVGDTGLSTACHLHLSLYKNGRGSDPREYVRK